MPRNAFVFGRFRAEVAEQRLLKDGARVPLTPKVFQTLVVLLENAGRLVTKDVLMERIWPDTFVADVTLAHNVSTLRKALGDGEEWIETVAKSGYRFVGDVRIVEDGSPDAPAPTSARAEVAPPAETAPSPSLPGEPVAPAAESRRARAGRRLLAGALVFAAVAALVIARKRVTRAPAPPAPIRSLAVLPFHSLEEGADDAYLELGLAESLIRRIGVVKDVTVRPLGAVERFRGGSVDAQEAGRELHVDAVLEGTVQRRNESVKVSVTLRRVSDGRPIWSATVTEVSANLFPAQEEISVQLLASLWPEVHSSERPFERTTDPAAYELYARGRYFWNQRTNASLEKAVAYLDQAVAKDPGFAAAHATLADAHALLGAQAERRRHLVEARAHVEKALALDDRLAEAHATIAMLAENADSDWDLAEKEYRRAIELNPGDPLAWHRLGELLGLVGRFDEGLALLHRASLIDPLSAIIGTDTAKVLWYARRFEEAERQASKVLETAPDFALAHFYRGLSLAWLDHRDGARGELSRFLELDTSLFARTVGGTLFATLGDRPSAEAIVEEVRAAMARGEPVFSFCVAGILAELGRTGEALDWLERAYDEGAVLLGMNVNPFFETMQGEPRFLALCAKLHLAVPAPESQKTPKVLPGR